MSRRSSSSLGRQIGAHRWRTVHLPAHLEGKERMAPEAANGRHYKQSQDGRKDGSPNASRNYHVKLSLPISMCIFI